MINLTSAPAFGFETASCNAQEYYEDMYRNAYDSKRKQYAELSPGQDFPLSDRDVNNICRNSAKTASKVANIVKVLGYIPLVGTLIGLSRISRASNASHEALPNKFNHTVRGCIELCSLGFLLLIPDLILTGYRAYQARSADSSVLA